MNVYYTHAPIDGEMHKSKNDAIAVSGTAYRWRQTKGGYVVDRAYNKNGLIFGGKNESKKTYDSKMV